MVLDAMQLREIVMDVKDLANDAGADLKARL
jgi:hypothetical protein